jgi:O-antigen/teichoic acid export membrane protein
MSLDTLETFPAGSERIGLVALSRASVVYALGGLAYKGVALVTIPLLARILSPAELGLLDLAAVIATLIGLVVVLGTDQAVAFHEPRSDSQPELWGSAVVIVVATGAALAATGAILQVPLAEALTGDSANGPIVAAASAYGAVVALTATGLNAVRLRGSPGAYAIASFVLVTAEMGIALAIAWLGLGSVALMVLGWTAGATLVLLAILVRFLPRLHAPNVATIRRLVAYGAPLVPAAVAWLLGDALIRGTLAREVEVSALGEYGIAYRLASVLGLAVTGFAVAWYPYLYRSPASEVAPRAAQALGMLILALATLGVAVTALAPEIIAVVAGSAYAAARVAVAPLAGGMVALGAFVLVGAVVGASGSTRRVAIAALIGAAIQVAGSLILVPVLGLFGAALASLIGYAVSALLLGATEVRVLAGRGAVVTVGVVIMTVAGLVAATAIGPAPLILRIVLVVIYALLAAVVARAISRGKEPNHSPA